MKDKSNQACRLAKVSSKYPNILVLDTENSQINAKIWQLKINGYIDPGRIIDDWFLICWSAKWYGNKEIMHDCVTPKEARRRNDKRIAKSIWKVLDKTDILITQNGDEFDIKKLNALFFKYNLKLPSSYKSIDTLKISRKMFRFSSNTLDYVRKYKGKQAKIETGGISLWDKCESGDLKSLKKMSSYCDNDVLITENHYEDVLPYITNHPNIGLMNGEKVACPNCGSKNVQKRGFNFNRSSKNQRWQCMDCSSWHSSPLKEGSQLR